MAKPPEGISGSSTGLTITNNRFVAWPSNGTFKLNSATDLSGLKYSTTTNPYFTTTPGFERQFQLAEPAIFESQWCPFSGGPITVVAGASIQVSFRPNPNVPYVTALTTLAPDGATYSGAWVHQVSGQYVATLVEKEP